MRASLMTTGDAWVRGRRPVGLALLFVLLTIALTWPQVLRPAGMLVNQDWWFNMWRIAWVAHQLARYSAPVDANIHYPERGTLV